MTENVVKRAEASGYDILMLTVDVSWPGKRDRDIRDGFRIPFRLTPRVLADLATHPRWSLATLAAGRPIFANYKEVFASAESLAQLQTTIISSRFVWKDLAKLRDRWRGRLLVKGLLRAEDASRAVELGCDGIVVSNHGGRQAAYAPASIEVLPAIAAAVGNKVPLLIDSGMRRGGDVIRAKALGAGFSFFGRAFGYGIGAGADAGARRAFDILRLELSSALAQLGWPDFDEVDRSVLV